MTTSSAIHSNALNFLSYVKTGVDPRTGQYTCSLALPDFNANDLTGPQLPLSLSYSPLNTVDSGFGTGWTLQLSQYDTTSKILSLSTGETFKVTSTSSGSDELLMKEKKIDSFHLHDLGDGRYRVVHKSGLVEELSTSGNGSLALPDTLYSAEGRHLKLTYVVFASGRLLKTISQADGTLLLDITRQSGGVAVRLHPNRPYEAAFQLVLQGSETRVASIDLPLGGSWRFTYERLEDLLCLTRVEGPLGGFETLSYHSQPHLFPGNDNRHLPRVARHLHDPGGGQPVIETRYDYSDRNFLGREAPGLSWEDDGLDNLYKVLSDYRYHSTEHLWDAENKRALRSITREFNRFHLITKEETVQGDCVQEVITDYYAEDGKPFEQQPPQCQLPKTVTTRWYRNSDNARVRIETVSSEFDVHGNPTVQVQANGISETSCYYPAAGEDGCPPDPHGFVRHLKSKTLTPAEAEHGEAPVLCTQHQYISLPPVDGGSHHWLALAREEVIHVNGGNSELQSTRHDYFNHPADSYLHGRLANTAIVLNGKGTFTDFFYSKATATRSDETVLRTVEILSTSFDKVKKTITREQSLLNGQPLLERDDNDVEIAYRYDILGRVTAETVAPGTQYAAMRSYEYELVTRPDQQATQVATDVKGVKTKSLLDGLKRVVSEQRQDVDKNPVTKPYRLTYQASYNAFGQLDKRTDIDWLLDEDLPLTSSYRYDEWGEQCGVTGADGVTEHREIRNSMNPPIRLEVHEWRDGMGKTVTRHNRFGKPDEVERYDLAGKKVSEKRFYYDGLGRTSHEFDELNQFRYYRYDAFDRMIVSGMPDGTEVERRYADHSSEDLPVWIGVDKVQLGKQTFDGLGRLTTLTVGPRCEQYHYDGGLLQASQRTTPGGQTICYTYAPSLTDSPVGVNAPDDQATYTYDLANAQLSTAQNQQGQREFDYDGCGHLSAERWIENEQTWTTSYRHSLAGRRLSSTDVNGLETSNTYDPLGRLQQVDQGDVLLCYTYDECSRPYLTTCEDRAAGITLTTTLEFDDWGREAGRTLSLTGQPERTISQGYRLEGRLETRHQQSEGQSLLLETFEYDSRGRLHVHQCSGSELPADRYGNVIVEQTFDYDALDNLWQVTTLFADGSDDVSKRSFAPDDPCRLINLTHTHADYPHSLDLDYDADGRLLYDENGQGLGYDSQGRLLQVTAPDGTVVSRYHYDAHNQLSGASHGDEAQARRFYQGGTLSCTVQDTTRISYLHDGDCPLSQQQPDTPDQTLLLLTNASRSVIAESQQQTLRATSYDAYGQRSNDALQCDLAFNGELRDRQTGWYLLGNGYRAYNPWLMCFHSPDSLSPFGAGGINPWMYCAGDPINFRDPTGHMPSWLGWTLAGIGMAVAIGTGVGFVAAGWVAAKGAIFSAAKAGFLSSGLATQVAFVAGALSTASQITSQATPDADTRKGFAIGAAAAGAIAGAAGLFSLWQTGTLSSIYNKAVGAKLPQMDFNMKPILAIKNRVFPLPKLRLPSPPSSTAASPSSLASRSASVSSGSSSAMPHPAPSPSLSARSSITSSGDASAGLNVVDDTASGSTQALSGARRGSDASTISEVRNSAPTPTPAPFDKFAIREHPKVSLSTGIKW